MELNNALPVSDRVKNVFLKEPIPFVSRREVNWRAVKFVSIGFLLMGVVILLVLPTSAPEQASYHEKVDPGSTASRAAEASPSDTALSQLEQGRTNLARVPRSLDYLYGNSGGGSRGGSRDRNGTMIVTRGGLDSKAQLPPGSRIQVRLIERAIVAGQSMPVIGLVSKDFVHEDGLAVPEGAKLFGEVSFDDNAERAQVAWRSIQMPDGRERPFSAISVSADGQVGIEGKIHSNAMKNTVGQTLTRFIGAYAEGSMQRGALGSNPGGSDNGLKNAVAETAKDRAEAWAEDLKKEKKWIELSSGTQFFAVLKEPFTFRDPGGYLR